MGGNSTSYTISYCYNTGNITNNSETYDGRTGGIVGEKGNVANVTNCCQLKNCIKKGTDTYKIGVAEKTEAEIKALNWINFTVDPKKNNGYPILTWEE